MRPSRSRMPVRFCCSALRATAGAVRSAAARGDEAQQSHRLDARVGFAALEPQFLDDAS